MIDTSQLTLNEWDILKAYAANGMRVRTTSKNAHFASSTIYYNFKQIQKKTGLNPQNFFDLAALLQNSER